MGDTLLLAGMVAAVYLPKAVPLVLTPERLPPPVERWLAYVAPALLSALVAPAILAPRGEILAPGPHHLPYLAAGLVALLTRGMLRSLGAGLLVLLLLEALPRA